MKSWSIFLCHDHQTEWPDTPSACFYDVRTRIVFGPTFRSAKDAIAFASSLSHEPDRFSTKELIRLYETWIKDQVPFLPAYRASGDRRRARALLRG